MSCPIQLTLVEAAVVVVNRNNPPNPATTLLGFCSNAVSKS